MENRKINNTKTKMPKIPLAQRILEAGNSSREFPGVYRLYLEDYFEAFAEIGKAKGGSSLEKAVMDLCGRVWAYVDSESDILLAEAASFAKTCSQETRDELLYQMFVKPFALVYGKGVVHDEK